MNKCFKWKTNDQYATPDNIYNVFINQMGFNDFNPLCEKYDDSLLKTFDCNLYCNPPYSNIEPFVDYMIKHASRGYGVVMLLPVRTGTKWFYKLYKYGCNIAFFTQRLHFSNKSSAPFDCMLVFLSNKTVSGFHKIYFIDRNLKEVKK